MDLKLSERTLNGRIIVELRGELDLSCAPALRERLLTILAEQPPTIILDLSGLQFMDSTGLTVLLATKRRAELLGGSLTLAAPQKIVTKVLHVTGLDTYFSIFPTVTEAAHATRPADPPKPAGSTTPGGSSEPAGPPVAVSPAA